MKLLDEKSCYQALKTHDARFDGRFFVGVTSTGIYCRPVCTAKTPKLQNCRFFPTAAVAEVEGFRPCLRCRPELAPGHSTFEASDRLTKAAVDLIEDGFLEENDIQMLAERLHVSDRHLRRVFQAKLGVSIIEHVQTQRLLLAKRLLTDTLLPITEIAMMSGFASVRRFNAAFKEHYKLKPSDLRKSTVVRTSEDDAFQFDLGYRPPYDCQAMLAFLSNRVVAGVESVEDGHYRRSVSIEAKGAIHIGWIDVEFLERKPVLRIKVSSSLARVIPIVLTKIKRLFDLSCEPAVVAVALNSTPKIFRTGISGIRVPGAFDGFEMAVRAILGQQVSVKAATTLAGRIAKSFGHQMSFAFDTSFYIFPRAAVIARCTQADLAMLGITSARAASIIGLARAVNAGAIRLDASADVASTIEALTMLPGIGDWTAQYIAMRALSWPDAFPHTDLGIKKALGKTKAKDILTIAEQWRPWRAYAAIALWQSLSGDAAKVSRKK